MKVSPEVPQWLLDIFNKIDFAKVSTMQRYTFITIIKAWCSNNLTLLNPNKQYSSSETKKIARDFDKDLLDTLNKYEYSNVSDKTKNEVKTILLSALKSLPLK